MGFTNALEFLKNYLSYLIEDWYNVTGSLDEFPFCIFYCTSEREFYGFALNYIVPLLIQEENLENLTSVASTLGVNTKEVVEVCFYFILQYILQK